MNVSPAAPRFQTANTSSGITATIPSRKNWFVILFLGAWLGGWFFGEISAISTLTSEQSPEPFLMFWLVGWTLGALCAASIILWQLFGQEIVAVDASSLVHRVEVLGIGRTRSFSLKQIEKLRSVDFSVGAVNNQASWMPPIFGHGVGTVAFDYGARTYRLAPALDEAEAKLLVEQLSKFMPKRSDTI
jgi:hypothetical protein